MSDSKLIHGRWVVTAADSEVLHDAAVLIEDQLIRQVGSWDSLRAANPDVPVLGDANSAVIPGLINAHHHSHAVSNIQQGIPDMLLEPWILALHALRPVDRYLNTLISAGIQLGAGITSVVDVLNAGGDAKGFADTVKQALSAHDTSGLRVALAAGTTSQSFLVAGAGEDQRFLDSLPEDVRPLAASLLPDKQRLSEDEYFAIMAELQRNRTVDSRVDLWYGPPGPQWVSDDCLQQIAEEAERWGCGIQTHVNESFYEKLHGPLFYGKPTMAHLDDLGVLGPRFSIAHGTWLNEQEIAIMARTGTAVSHNPSSNLRLRAGIAPFHALLQHGVTTAIGMDSTTLNENEDMFAEMRLALRLQRSPVIDQPVPTAADVFHAATRGGARLLGKDQQLGRLLPGYAADLVILNTNNISWPWIAPECDLLELILLRAQRNDIDQVLIDGEVVWRDGAPTRFDLAAAAEELAAQLAATDYPQDKQQAVAAVQPYLQSWYANWQAPELKPWLVYNSRH